MKEGTKAPAGGMDAASILRGLATSGTPEVWEALFEGHGDRIYRICRRVLRNDSLAEDACQEALIQIRDNARLFKPPKDKPESAARSWIARVSCNVALNMLREQRKAKQLVRRSLDQQRGEPEDKAEDKRLDDVMGELSRLPEKFQVPLMLHFLCNHDYTEMSIAMGCTPAAAKMRVHRGLEHMRSRLAYAGLILAPGQLTGILQEPYRQYPEPQGEAAQTVLEGPSLSRWNDMLLAAKPSAIAFGSKSFLLVAVVSTGLAALVGGGVFLVTTRQSAGGVDGRNTSVVQDETEPRPDRNVAQPTSVEGLKSLDRFIEDLAITNPPDRKRAAQQLVAAGAAALERLRQAYTDSTDWRFRARITDIRKRIYEANPHLALKIEVLAPKKVLILGKDHHLDYRVRVTNIADQAITVLKHNVLNNLMNVWTYRLLDPQGKDVERLPTMRTAFSEEPIPYTFDEVATAAPKDTFETTVQVVFYNLREPRPGDYTLLVTYKFSGGAVTDNSTADLNEKALKCEITAPPVKLTLVERNR